MEHPLPLIEVEPIRQKMEVLDVLIQMYNDRILRFKIRESTLAFRPEDEALIIGLCRDGDVVSFEHEKE